MFRLWKVLDDCRQIDAIRLHRSYLVRIVFINLFALGLFTANVIGQEEQGNDKEYEESSKEDSAKPSKERYDKSSRTPAQKKISSELLDRIHGKQNKTRQPTTPETRSNDDAQPENITLVDIKAEVTESLLLHIETLGGVIINNFPEYQAIRAEIPVEELETLAESSDVESIRAADIYQLQR